MFFAVWTICPYAKRARRAIGLLVLAAPLLAPGGADGQTAQIPSSQPAVPAWGEPFGSGSMLGGTGTPGFDPYGGSAIGPPPPSVPYTYSAPTYAAPNYAAPAYDPGAPPPTNGFSGEANSYGWQPGTYGFESPDGTVTRFRRALARTRWETTVLLGDDEPDAFGVTRTEFSTTLACPLFGSVDTPLLMTPGFAFNWFDGPGGDPFSDPRGPDMPPRAYDAYVDFAYNPRWTPTCGGEFGFRTGVWTDFEEVNSDSVRLLGRALGVVSTSPNFDLLFGVVYLDRLRVKLLPAGGVRWRPTPAWDLYLVFPNPKIRRALGSNGSADWWWYVAGEYGGGSWTVERVDLGDQVDYNDIRIYLGFEWQTPAQATGHFEIGYVFDRELVFRSGQPSVAGLDDTVMFRLGIGF